MIENKSLGVYFICYYNLILPSILIFGAISIIIFSLIKGNGDAGSIQLHLLFFILLCTFHVFSATKYLHQENIGRYLLIICSLIQVFFSVKGLLMIADNTVLEILLNLGMFLIGLWAAWYLNTEKAKEWLKNKT